AGTEDGVARVALVAGAAGAHVHGAAVDGDGTGADGVDAVRFACRIGFHAVDRTGREAQIAVDAERADGVARRQRAAGRHGDVADSTRAAERTAVVDGGVADDG